MVGGTVEDSFKDEYSMNDGAAEVDPSSEYAPLVLLRDSGPFGLIQIWKKSIRELNRFSDGNMGLWEAHKTLYHRLTILDFVLECQSPLVIRTFPPVRSDYESLVTVWSKREKVEMTQM
ncbi:hypothetical protein Tco_0650423 [Tanacetum coccineum]